MTIDMGEGVPLIITNIPHTENPNLPQVNRDIGMYLSDPDTATSIRRVHEPDAGVMITPNAAAVRTMEKHANGLKLDRQTGTEEYANKLEKNRREDAKAMRRYMADSALSAGDLKAQAEKSANNGASILSAVIHSVSDLSQSKRTSNQVDVIQRNIEDPQMYAQCYGVINGIGKALRQIIEEARYKDDNERTELEKALMNPDNVRDAIAAHVGLADRLIKKVAGIDQQKGDALRNAAREILDDTYSNSPATSDIFSEVTYYQAAPIAQANVNKPRIINM